ncbi:nickel-dependent lactate racemase family protein [Paramaledivibacter caminithermalis]|jgi:nickel-dependent lactate racemase|uniref:Nickel-dependent lactate racemase n=1 Tax=Paramaledivibacter caminithermalis (strain DSM 15212 / CIP 107654 / DViRD3) TaxID=1121301 RepID=A0A1M6MH85_PARC5|nr:nickel-dependent lactate racemase [Paramaledivibacter caminithermalis]SHJ82726.1 Nickel-dependent lactate racemase [Paramaledivibacter caminithermalis DSM 15212]
MKYKLKYGKGEVEFEIDEKNYMGQLLPKEIEYDLKGEEEVERAINNPIGTARLKDIVKEGEKIAIVTSDITRPMPSKIALPPLIRELKKANIKEENITIVLALGSHREHTEEEKISLLGEKIYESNIQILDSNMNECINLGKCKNKTPVDIFRPVAEADRIICMGNIEYHYFAGYSGGAKALMPGVSSHEAIQVNHSNMVKGGAFAGNIETNPVRQDIDQVGEFIKIDFIINVVLNSKKEIVKAVAGHYIKAHREGCKYLDEMYGIQIEDRADIVIVSPGGFPKDINIYQSQKGLDNAKHAVRDGGIIILVASAKERFGEKTFEEWMLTKTPQEMIEEIKKNFRLGGHKAAAIAMILQKAKIYMVSDLEDELVTRINFKPFRSVQAALDSAINELGEDSKIMIMPTAGSTLPRYVKKTV